MISFALKLPVKFCEGHFIPKNFGNVNVCPLCSATFLRKFHAFFNVLLACSAGCWPVFDLFRWLLVCSLLFRVLVTSFDLMLEAVDIPRRF